MPNDVTEKISSLDKYEIKKVITGGMNAYAFKARHCYLDIDVFLKVYEKDPYSSQNLWEPQCLAQIVDNFKNNAHIVNIYDADVIDDLVIISMEYVEGHNLYDAINLSNIGLMDAIKICDKILQGLSDLHKLKFLHRDLKLANIMLTPEGIPKISDFGSIAKFENPSDFISASKHSALYLPHEAWQNQSYGICSDIYQVGVILYELINGSLPCDNHSCIDSVGQKQLKYMGKSFDSLDDYDKSKFIDGCLARKVEKNCLLQMRSPLSYFSGKIKKIVNKATSKDIQNRYSLASSFRTELIQLNLPNWTYNESFFEAKNWRNYHWILEFNRKNNEWIAKRYKVNSHTQRIFSRDKKINNILSSIEKFK